jgi:hypothetical protein
MDFRPASSYTVDNQRPSINTNDGVRCVSDNRLPRWEDYAAAPSRIEASVAVFLLLLSKTVNFILRSL